MGMYCNEDQNNGYGVRRVHVGGKVYTALMHEPFEIPDEHHGEAVSAGLVYRGPSPAAPPAHIRAQQSFEQAVACFEQAGLQSTACDTIRRARQARSDGRPLDMAALSVARDALDTCDGALATMRAELDELAPPPPPVVELDDSEVESE